MSFIPGNTGVASSFPDGFLVADGSVTAPTFKFSDTQTGFYRPGINQWALASAGVQTWSVSATGAHTFGTTAGSITHLFQSGAATKLRVSGSGATSEIEMIRNGGSAGGVALSVSGTGTGGTLTFYTGTNSTPTTLDVGVYNETGSWRIGPISAIGGTGYAGINIVGRTNGSSPSAGYIGERKVATRSTLFTQASPAVNTYYDVTSLSLSLEAGIWDVYTQIPGNAETLGGSGYAVMGAAIRRSDNTVFGSCLGSFAGVGLTPSNVVANLVVKTRISISATTVFKTSVILAAFSGSPTFANFHVRAEILGGESCLLEAVRIA